MDLKKAFDTVNHSILLNKLHKYGIRGNMHELLSDYLTNRIQFTVLHNIISQPNVLNTGVPQGSTLGPLLFLIYINDLPLISNFSTRLFADDTCLIMTDSNLKLLNKKVNMEINKVSQWMNLNKLKLNYDKCKYILFKPSNKKIDDNITFQISLTNSIKLEQVKSFKYLGVVLDEKLKWTNHIQLLCKKLAQVCEFSEL